MPDLSTIVRAVIHPAIGIARVGNSRETDGHFIGPEVPDESALPVNSYKDSQGALKRQAARFRIYGLDAAGQVVAELTADNSQIEWNVHVANKKAAWYQFHLALDIPEASLRPPATPEAARRNRMVTGADRRKLVIDPGSRSIRGRNTQGGAAHQFDTGKFHDLTVPLGELRTDEAGRLLVLGGLGVSRSISGAPPQTFANNDGWHDDTSDGPVDARVMIGGRPVPVTGAWVAVGPPNFAPALKTARTLFDLLHDRMIAWGFLPAPARVSFQRQIRPIFERLTGLQWVNQGFAAWFGAGAPFETGELMARLADRSKGNREFRERIFRQFRNPAIGRSQLGDSLWPQFYGDALDGLTRPTLQNPDTSRQVPAGLASLSELQLGWLKRWSSGDFDSDAPANPPRTIDQVPLADQPAALDEGALAFCLADAFHPGCELTWPMRIAQLYDGPFRIRRRTTPEPDFGPVLSAAVAVSSNGPLAGAAAGDLTRWMAVPWQTDTASCLSGYNFFSTSSSLPTFWPARVPNQVLREAEYAIVMDRNKSPEERRAAFHLRHDWFRIFPGDDLADIGQMIADFHLLGIIEERDGPTDLPGIPVRIWVESKPGLPDPAGGGLFLARVDGEATQGPSFAGRKLRQIGRFGQLPE